MKQVFFGLVFTQSRTFKGDYRRKKSSTVKSSDISSVKREKISIHCTNLLIVYFKCDFTSHLRRNIYNFKKIPVNFR